jgi:hypothetical protein
MNAMLEARMVAARIHFPDEAVHATVALPARMTLSSQGSRIAAIMFCCGENESLPKAIPQTAGGCGS